LAHVFFDSIALACFVGMRQAYVFPAGSQIGDSTVTINFAEAAQDVSDAFITTS
jgi:hypothetical protein